MMSFILQVLKFPIHTDDLRKYHLSSSDQLFAEEKVRQMEMQARRLRLHRRSLSVTSDVTPSEFSDVS